MKGKSRKLFLLSLIVLTIYNFSIFAFALEGEDLELTGEAALLIDEDNYIINNDVVFKK